MKITIIETGLPPKPLRDDWPRYPQMFETLLSRADQGLDFETIELATGAALPSPETLEAILITGSAVGVYDDEPWMQPLFQFIRAAADNKVPQFGICFGHQALAEALGGKVEQSDKGWGVGRHVYAVRNRPAWMTTAPPSFAIAVSHQDQVISAPPNTEIIASSDFCEFAGLAYNDFPAASFQGHPEFSAAFGSALHSIRRDRIGDAAVDRAIESFKFPLDSMAVGHWMAQFFRENGTGL